MRWWWCPLGPWRVGDRSVGTGWRNCVPMLVVLCLMDIRKARTLAQKPVSSQLVNLNRIDILVSLSHFHILVLALDIPYSKGLAGNAFPSVHIDKGVQDLKRRRRGCAVRTGCVRGFWPSTRGGMRIQIWILSCSLACSLVPKPIPLLTRCPGG